MKRRLEKAILKDLKSKIVLLSGPRQVGKTTLSRQLGVKYDYLNFDAAPDRKIIMHQEWDRHAPIIILDEIHKMKKWKSWIKGVYDTEGIPPGLLLTGSARMDVYRKGGDSLAGRHFNYRLLPVSIKEAAVFMPAEEALERIMQVGGFPEPFLKGERTFYKRWRKQHLDVILREDLIDLEKVRDIKSIELMVDMLRERVGAPVSYSSLATNLQVSVNTVKHWLQILENLYVIFPVRPYHKNIARSILKNSKYYFYDTGAVMGGDGAKLENAVACSLLSELYYHEETTGERTSLCYLRDKEKREVDFLVTVERKPRQMIEVKWADDTFSKNLLHFKRNFHQIECLQLVGKTTRRKTRTHDIILQPAGEYLKNITIK